MTSREKYGEWGVILGATEGMGKALSERIASEGMSVVLVGRRGEQLEVLGKELVEKYNVEYKVVTADLANDEGVEKVFAATEGLDMGFMSYVACFHTFGKLQDTPWETHEQMLNVNVISFLKVFYHYMGIFAEQDRGAVINISSLTAIASSPFNAQYGAGKSYILKLTEAVAREAENTNVDVLAITLGSTITPTLMKNLPGGPEGEAVMSRAMTSEDCVTEAFDSLGKDFSIVVGQHNRDTVNKWKKEMTTDEVITYMGSFYE